MVNSSANYWIAANALSISLNALGEPNRCQCGLATGSVIMCYVSGVEGLEYDNGHNYRRWPLTISPTFFNDNAQKYVYVKIPRTSAIGTTAMICWPSVKLSIEGREVLADGTEGEQIGSTDYYYIWLQGIISSSGDNGQTARTWVEPCQSGTLSTDEAINPEGSQWYSWNNITQQVTFLKEIIMSATSRFFNIRLGNHNLTGVAVDDTIDEDSTSDIVTPAYVKAVSNDRYLRKDQDDYTPYLLGIGEVQSNFIQSSEYTGDGMLDAGYKLWYENGRAKLVIDDLVARGKFSVNELESRIWTYAGGNMVFSGAGSTVFYVEYLNANDEALGYTYVREPWLLRGKMMLASGIAWAKRKQIQRELTAAEKAQVVKFRCYEYSDDGTMQTRNWWRANDLAYCSSLNHVKDKANSDGSYSGSASNTVFWRRVAGIGSKKIPALNDGRVYDYVDLWNLQNVTGQTYKDTDGSTKTITDSVPGYDSTYNDWPAAGDVIVQRGNAVDVTRQCCVTIEVEGDQLHGFKIYDTINTYSAANTQWVSLGYDLQTGKADAKIYGDCYIGARDQSTYVRYNRTTGVLDIKAKINMASPLGDTGKTFAQTLTAIEGQIDKKAETWRQATDPSSDWTTDTEKAEHVGDLWMDTSANGGKKTYIYTDKGASANPRYTWEAQDVPEEVFDEIDGKGAIYSGWEDWIVGTENKLQVRDLFIPTSNTTVSGVTYKAMKVYKCTTAGATPSFVEVDYTDDTAVNELRANQYVSYLLNGSYDTDIANAAAAYTHDAALNAVKGALKANTVIEGGLMLTSLIALRQLNSGGDPDDPSDYTTWAGVSGQYVDRTTPDPQDPSTPYAKGHGIAAWYGGAMIDYEMLTPEQQADGWGGEQYNLRWAKGLDRMDGSGYRASGNISWKENGEVTIQGETIKAQNIYLNDVDITDILNDLRSMFVKENIAAVGETPVYVIKALMDFYSVGGISALGYTSGGGGGVTGALYGLIDVKPDDPDNPTKVYGAQTGYVLTYGSDGKWYAASPSVGATTLNTLTDVTISSVADGQVLLYNGTSGKWINSNLPPTASFGTDGNDYVPLTIGSTTKNLLTAHQSLSNYVTKTGSEALTNKTYNGYTLGDACAKGVTDNSSAADVTSSDTKLITARTLYYQLANKDYLPKSGGTLTGALTINPSNTSSFQDGIILNDKGTGASEALTIKWTSGSYTTGVKLSADLANKYLVFHNGTAWQTIYHSGNNPFIIRGELADAYINGTTYSTLDNGTYLHTYTGASETIIHFQRSSCSASGLDIRFKYPQDSSNPLQYRKCIDSNRFASTDWVTLIDSLNIGSQSVSYATSAGDADTVDGLHVASGRADSANVIVRTDSSGYLNCGWINTTSGGFYTDESISRVYCSNDGYLRYLSPSDFISKMSILPLSGGTMTGSIIPSSDQAIDLGSSTKRWRYIYSYGMWGKSGAELRLGGNDSTLMYLTSDAKCGIGTDSPSQKLHVSGGLAAITNNSRTLTIGAQNSSAIHIYNDNNSTTFVNGGFSSNGNGSYDLGTTSYYWNVGYFNRIIAKSTTDAAASLANHVALITGDPAGQHLEFDGNEIMSKASGTTNSILYLNAEGGNVVICEGAGNVGVGVTSPSYKLHVSGDIYATGGVTTLSDANKKDVQGDLNLSVEQIAKAPAIKFLWKDDHSLGMQAGTIAQYWQKALPEVVSNKSDELSMQYGVTALVSTIITARKVVTHEEEIQQLKQRISELENEVKQLKSA